MQERKNLINIFFIELLFYILLIQNETNCTVKDVRYEEKFVYSRKEVSVYISTIIS